MRPLELWLLKQLCDKYEIDHQEIDLSLTYWENKKHITSLIFPQRFGPLEPDKSRWEREMWKWEAQREWFLENHFLHFYLACIDAGDTTSAEMGEPLPHYPLFSLREFVALNRVP